MNVAVIGSRTFADKALLFDSLSKVPGISLIISGGAVGADRLAEQYAREMGIPCKVFLPDWKQYGRSAGIIRNKEIVKAADIVIAFWDGQSPGTKYSIALAHELKKELQVIQFQSKHLALER